MSRVRRSGPMLLAFLFVAAGCGSGGTRDGASDGPPQVTADKVCHGALSKAGVRALGIMTGVKKYSPYDVEPDPAKAASELAASYVPGTATDPIKFTMRDKGSACAVNAVGGPLWSAEVHLSFVEKVEAKGGFRLGSNVAFASDVFADLYFPCRSAKLAGSGELDEPPVVKAELSSTPHGGKRKPESASETERLQRANLTFLNAVAYVSASDLGCVGHGGLRSAAEPRRVSSSSTPSTPPSHSSTR